MSSRSRIRAWVALALTVAVAVLGWAMWASVSPTAGLSAASRAGAAPVEPIPSAPLSSSPVTGTIVSHADEDDVFTVDLDAGEAFTARISAQSPAVVTLLLYGPGVTSLEQDDLVVAGWEVDRYPSYLVVDTRVGSWFVAPEAGRYHLRVLELGGFGGYTIDWAKGAAPTLTISKSAYRISYGKTARIYGAVRSAEGTGLAGERVELWSGRYADRYPTTKVASSVTTTGGVYSFPVKPLYKTKYTVVSMGAVPGFSMRRSSSTTVLPRVYLGRPTASATSTYRNRTFSVWGSLKPRHEKGAKTVSIRCYQRNSGGTYVLRKTVRAVNSNYNGYTRYKGKVSLPYRGRWKLYAYTPEDSQHAATKSSALTITVK